MERKGEQVKLKIFAVPFRSRAEPAERSIFRVVGGLRYRIWWEETASGWSLKCSLSFDLLQTFSFFMTGRRNRAHAPSRFLPPRPSLPSGFIFGSKNGIERIFSLSKQPQNSVRTSLVPLSICLWEVRACGGRRGVKNAAVSRRPYKAARSFRIDFFKSIRLLAS